MRNPIALTCLLSAFVVNAAIAQCPNSHGKRFSRAPSRARFQPSVQRACPIPTQVPTCQIKNRCAAVQGYRVVQGNPVIQGYTVVPSINNLSIQPWSVVTPSAVAQNAPSVAQSNCSCNSGGNMPSFSPQGSSQAASILEQRRNPFSLAGHAQEGKAFDYCLQQFLACCEGGGKDCMLSYYKCAEITGEPLRHAACPSTEPVVED